jgi:hypothetical protein
MTKPSALPGLTRQSIYSVLHAAMTDGAPPSKGRQVVEAWIST